MRRNCIVVALVIVLIGGIAWVPLREPPEPVYQGKTLAAWFEQDMANLPFSPPPADATNRAQARAEAERAIRHIGTRAIPFFLSKVRQKGSRLINFAAKWKWSGKYFEPMIERQFVTTFCDQLQAPVGFAALTPEEGEAAVPPLLKLVDNSDVSVRQCALNCLQALHLEEPARRRVSAEIAKFQNAEKAGVK